MREVWLTGWSFMAVAVPVLILAGWLCITGWKAARR